MSVVPKSLFTWLILLVFSIFLVIRADGKVDWNWLIIFIPLWILDAAVLIQLVVNIIIHFMSSITSTVDRNDMTKKRKFGLLACCLLKIVFQLLLCLHLEQVSISLYYVLVPFWLLLIAGVCDNFKVLISRHPYR